MKKTLLLIAIIATLPGCGLFTRVIVEHHEWQLNRKAERSMDRAWDKEDGPILDSHEGY